MSKNPDQAIEQNAAPSCKGESCPICESEQISVESQHQEFPYGDALLSADVDIFTCSECNASYTGEQAEKARYEVVCRHVGVLSPSEVTYIRGLYGMSRAAFAREFGFGEASLDRWENGAKIQGTALDNYLFLLQDRNIGARVRQRDHKVALAGASYPSQGENGFPDLTKFRALKQAPRKVLEAQAFPLRGYYAVEGMG